MSKNPEDEKLVTKGALKIAIHKIHLLNMHMNIKDVHWQVIPVKDVLCAIDKLPAKPVVNKQRLQERIRDYLRVRRGWISGTVEGFLDEIFEEKKP